MSTYAAVQGANSQQRPQPFSGGANLLPGDSCPKALLQIYDFAASGIPAAGYTSDMTQLVALGNFKAIQTLYIDNSANNGYAAVFNPAFGQSVSLPPGYQGYFPILTAIGSGNQFAISSTGNQIVKVQYLNVFMPWANWAATVTPVPVANPIPVADAILDGTVAGGRQLVTAINGAITTVDGSGTIASGGTAQVLFVANPARRGYRVQNIDGSLPAEAIWINDTGTATVAGAGSYGLAAAASAAYPGGSYDGQSIAAVSIIAATTGHKFTAIQW